MARSFRRFMLVALALFMIAAGGASIAWAGSLQQAGAGSIAGTVFFDLNLNGVLDAGEGGQFGTGVDGALVHLQDANGARLKTYLTSDAEGGAFSFSGLAPGSYTVVEEDPATFGSTTANAATVTLTTEAPSVSGVNFGDVVLRTLSGRVYEDRDANGAYNPGDAPLVGATITVVDDTNTNGQVDADEDVVGTAVSDANGLYAVQNVLPGARLMIVQNAVGGVIGEPIPVTLFADPAGGVQGEDVPVYTIGGRVYEDRDGSSSYSPGDVPLAEVTVTAVVDKDADGQVDADETAVGSAVSNEYGLYVIQYVQPGPHIMILQNAVGGVIGDPIPIVVPADPTGGVGTEYDLAVRPEASLSGVIWHDVDGNELIDDGEGPLADVRLTLYIAACGVTGSGSSSGTATTGADGSYRFDGLTLGACYELQPDAATLPAGWVSSTDAMALLVQITTTEQTLNVGYYDPLSVDPLRQADWKKELRQYGRPRYTTEQLNSFIATAEASSRVFTEMGYGIRDTLLKRPIRGTQGSALQEHAALWLNLASKRLFDATPIRLPELTNQTTVRGARDEIEAVLLKVGQTTAEYERARKLARSINAGKGLGYGKQGTMQASRATYRGSSVASRLRPGGEYVDMYDVPLYAQSWSSGTLNPSTNVLNPQVRIKALAFYGNAVLEVQQTLPDGRTISLGTATPSDWNTSVNATYTFGLRGVTTVSELASARLQFYTRTKAAVGPTTQLLAANTAGGGKMDIKSGQSGAQSFVYGESGEADYYIQKVTLHLSRESDAPNASLLVSIGTGVNTGAVAGSETSVAPTQVTNNTGGSSFISHDIVFSTPVGPLTAGRRYYLNLANYASNGKAYDIEYSGDDDYRGGTYYKQSSDDKKDAWFQIWGSTDSAATSPVSTGGKPHIKIDSAELIFGY